MVLGSDHWFQCKTADIVFLVAIKAVGSLVFNCTHGIVIGEIAFIFVVLGDSFGPIRFVSVGFRNEEYCFGSAFLVIRETFQHTGTFFNNLLVLLRFLAAWIRLHFIRDTIKTRCSQFGRLFVKSFRIEHVVQIGTASAPVQQCDEQKQSC